MLDPACFETEIISEDDYGRAAADTREHRYLGDGRILLYKDSSAAMQAWYLSRIMRDVDAADGWRYFNTGRLAAHGALTANIEKIQSAHCLD